MDTSDGNSLPDAPVADDAESGRPLGEIFVELGFITRAQLDAALAEQLRTGVRLGEILVEQGGLTRLDLATALAEHWEPRHYPGSGDAAPIEDEPPSPATRSDHVEPEPLSAANGSVGGSVVVLDEVDRSIAELRDSLASFAEVRAADAVATGARLSTIEDTVSELAGRLDGLMELLNGIRSDIAGLVERRPADDLAEVAALRVETASLTGRFDELLGLRHADAHAARAANERLEGRLTALAARQAADQEANRTALTATRADEGIAAEPAGLGEQLAELRRRVDLQGAIGEEQTRAIEVALLEGLSALGERLILAAKKQSKPGKRLRRSIDGLGAAIADVGARVEERSLGTKAEGCVAFAPTGSGYRLVELRGRPDVGATIELDGEEGVLVVTRYGRSPLPFDSRPCAFLDRT